MRLEYIHYGALKDIKFYGEIQLIYIVLLKTKPMWFYILNMFILTKVKNEAC